MHKFRVVRSLAWAGWFLCLAGSQAFAASQAATPGGQGVVAPASSMPLVTGPGGTDQQNDITLNFVNADVRDVAKAILGDYLKLNYEIGANVQGTVTIQTNQPLTRAQVLPALEQGLSLNGMALIRNKNIYEIVTLADVHRELGAATTRNVPSGYGVEVFRLKYVNAAALMKVLQPLAGAENNIRVDESRNLLIVEGTAQERQTIAEDVALFDADWLSGMSFALFTPENLDADELAKELDSVMGGLNSPIAGVVRLIPIERLNAVLAISPQPRYLDQLRSWVVRLDKPGQGNDKKISVYHVQNGRAKDLANTLRRTLFGGGNDTSQDNTETTQNNPSPALNSTSSFMPGGGNGLLTLGGGAGTPPSSSGNSLTPSRTGSREVAPLESSGQDQQGMPKRYETVEGVNRQGLSSINITADETNNALVILATSREYAMIEKALHQLDTAPVQVLLEASIAEVTLTKEIQYGFQYFNQPNTENQIVLSNGGSSQISATFPGFAYIFSRGTNIQATLTALGTLTKVNVISSPEVLVLNNQTANLEVGDEVPVLTAQSVSTIGTDAPIVNAVQYIDTGVILKVTPRVNRGGQVMMDISQEVSGVDNSASTAIGSPTIQQRKINSSVSIEDGQTVALGGLFTDQVTKSDSGIPYLQDIPYLGKLFNTTDNQHDKTELMVLITPHVVDDVQKAQAITDELRKKLPDVQPLFDKRG